MATLFVCTMMALGCAHGGQEMKLEQALTAARSGAHGPFTAGHLRIETLGDGGVRVTRGEKWEPRQPVRGVSDAWITTQVKSKLARDTHVVATEINVDSDETGLVSLRGHVDSARMAARAIEDTLDVHGVNAVDSDLTF